MERIPKGSPEYFLIEKEYNSLIENITREKDFKPFIGGLPVTLERKDLFTLVSKDIKNNYRYTVTQKVDGTRMLLFAGYKELSGRRKIVFIDRNNNFYLPKNFDRINLPDFKGPRLLIDGEILVFDKDYPLSEVELRQPYIPNDCFMIIRTTFMTGNKIKPYLNKIKELKYIHYFKWSFSLVVSSLAMMLCNDKVTRCVFKITEEKQRNAYIENGKIITKVPDNYKK